MTIFCVHGFLGLAQDWNMVPFNDARVESTDLWNGIETLTEDDAFYLWARAFNENVRRILGRRTGPGSERRVLVGYSLGARLAMHALISAPELFDACVFVSGNPGLQQADERGKRLEQDLVWADRFLREEWRSVTTAWNNQPVLATSPALPRAVSDFSRAALARSLDVWSLGRQEDLREKLAQISVPQLWVTGENDLKFTELTRDFTSALGAANASRISHRSIPGAGHRVPWDRPRVFADAVNEFIRENVTQK